MSVEGLADDQFRTCPRCEYALIGRPEGPACSECGYPYDDSLRVVDVWVGERRPSWWGGIVLALPAWAFTMTAINKYQNLGLSVRTALPAVGGVALAAMFCAWLLRYWKSINRKTDGRLELTTDAVKVWPDGFQSTWTSINDIRRIAREGRIYLRARTTPSSWRVSEINLFPAGDAELVESVYQEMWGRWIAARSEPAAEGVAP